MTRSVMLNNVDHADLRVITRHGPEFGDSVNQVLVFPTEFAEIQREYPIFFRRYAGGAFQAVALLGLDRNENLFLDVTGWTGRYVPAVQGSGPFRIGLQSQGGDSTSPGEPMIHVDLDHPRISTAGDGEPVFMPHGGNAPYLDQIARVLRVIYAGIEMSGPMFAAFEEAGLIEPVTVEVKLGESEQYAIPDYYTIGQERLARLDGATLERLNGAGFLQAAFMVVASLGNVNRLIELKIRKRAAE